MPIYDATFSGHPFTLRLNVAVASQNISANTSTLNWNLKAIKTAANTPYLGDSSATWSYNYDGSGHWGPYNFNGSIGQVITIASGSFTVTHDADGTRDVTSAFSADGKTTLGSASGSGFVYHLPTIPRATQPTVTPTSGNTDVIYDIGTDAASSGFFHDLAYSFDDGATYTNLILNQPASVHDYYWTPTSSLIPNATSDTAKIRCITRSSSGGTIIGTKTVNLTLTIPSTMKPSVSSVAWTDAQTSGPDIPTLMGGTGRFLQRWSLLKPTVTAAGTGGATIASSAVTMGGQTVASGTAFSAAPTISGACAYSAIATDSRGVASNPYSNTVAVTAYNNPSLPTPTVQRTSDAAGAVASPTGTYLAITPLASVSDLTFGGTQKNLLEWQVETRPIGGSFTTIQAWTNATVSGVTWTTKKVIAGYASTTGYEVKVSVRDLFGKNGFDTANTVQSVTVTVPSETVYMDWNRGVGVGMGKYHSLGFLDVGGDIYMNGNKVIDASALATSTETQAGTATDKAITPAALSLKTTGVIPVASAAARDTLFGGTPTQGSRCQRLDMGWEEVYYGLYNSTTNPGGALVAGWWPVAGIMPSLEVSATAAEAKTATPAVITTWATTDYQRTLPTLASGVFTVPSVASGGLPGRYRIDLQVLLGGSGTAAYVDVRKNGTNILAANSDGSSSSLNGSLSVSAEVFLAVGDTLSGFAGRTAGSITTRRMAITYLGPA